MIFAYIRVSTDDQTVKNQKDMIERAGYRVDKWLADEGVSGTIDWTKREINVAIEEADEGDTIIVAELSRLGRSLKQILEKESKLTMIVQSTNYYYRFWVH